MVDAPGNTREKYVHVIRVATPNLRRVFCKSDCSKVNHKLLLLIKQKIGKIANAKMADAPGNMKERRADIISVCLMGRIKSKTRVLHNLLL